MGSHGGRVHCDEKNCPGKFEGISDLRFMYLRGFYLLCRNGLRSTAIISKYAEAFSQSCEKTRLFSMEIFDRNSLET